MRLIGRGLGNRRMSAPSLAELISVFRPTPSSIMNVENRSPTTTATAIAMTSERKRATSRFLPIRKDVFNYDHPGFVCAVLKPLLGKTMGLFFLPSRQAKDFLTENHGNSNRDFP